MALKKEQSNVTMAIQFQETAALIANLNQASFALVTQTLAIHFAEMELSSAMKLVMIKIQI